MIRRWDPNPTALVALVGALFFSLLFFWGTRGTLAGEPSSSRAEGSLPQVASRSIRGDLGGWLRAGSFTLILRDGAFTGRAEVRLTADGSRCRLEPESLEVSRSLLRYECPDQGSIEVLHRRPGGDWHVLAHESYPERGYVQVAVAEFGEFRFESR